MKNNPIQIIYLNGPSSSGKTALAKALQNAFEDPFLHVSFDKIISWMPEKFNNWEGGEAPLGFSWKLSKDASGNLMQELQTGPYAERIIETFKDVVLMLANMGHRLIIDDVAFGKQEVDQWKVKLKDFRVLWVGVNAPLHVLEQREKDRGNRILGSARGQFHKVHSDVEYDIEIDTHQLILSKCVDRIKSSVNANTNLEKSFKQESKPNAINLKIKLVKATKEDKETIQNLGRFYVYDMYRYCGCLPGWNIPPNGLLECIDLSSYCEQPDRHAFLIKVDDELAGFVLINKVGSTSDVDWNVGEFFIASKFQGKGVGRYVAEQIFNQFPGIWETTQIPENKAAIDFWEKVVHRYSKGKFERSRKIIPEPKPHPMIVLKFSSKGK